jgi:hypothetical protein
LFAKRGVADGLIDFAREDEIWLSTALTEFWLSRTPYSLRQFPCGIRLRSARELRELLELNRVEFGWFWRRLNHHPLFKIEQTQPRNRRSLFPHRPYNGAASTCTGATPGSVRTVVNWWRSGLIYPHQHPLRHQFLDGAGERKKTLSNSVSIFRQVYRFCALKRRTNL